MVKSCLNKLIERSKDYSSIAIVGCGYAGKELYTYFKLMEKNISCFLDNNQNIQKETYDGKKILKPCKLIENSLYVIAVVDSLMRKELLEQLLSLGISEYDIEIYYSIRDYEFWSNLEIKYYEEELKQLYLDIFGWDLDVNNPKRYTEKIFLRRIYNLEDKKSQLTDKYLVREWIKEKIGEKYLVKNYGVWNNAREIDFEKLPKSFVLKANHGSGYNVVVRDKNKIDKEEIYKKFDMWLNEKYGFKFFELHYNAIVPKIICEEYLEGVADSVYDYNIYCFHGKPMYIHCIKGSHRENGVSAFYTVEWEKLEFNYGGYPMDEDIAPKPKELQCLLDLSEKLSAEFEHVRVDWYDMPDGRVLLGEMTFTPWGGCTKFVPEEYDKVWGDLIK